jgi:hypothetical protein
MGKNLVTSFWPDVTIIVHQDVLSTKNNAIVGNERVQEDPI